MVPCPGNLQRTRGGGERAWCRFLPEARPGAEPFGWKKKTELNDGLLGCVVAAAVVVASGLQHFNVRDRGFALVLRTSQGTEWLALCRVLIEPF